jgi:DNA-binding CsgD family transcriptional regulator
MRKTYYFSVPDALSSCEQEITRLTCIGWSNKQIAERLHLKVEAVQVHLNSTKPYVNLSIHTAPDVRLQGRRQKEPLPQYRNGLIIDARLTVASRPGVAVAAVR